MRKISRVFQATPVVIIATVIIGAGISLSACGGGSTSGNAVGSSSNIGALQAWASQTGNAEIAAIEADFTQLGAAGDSADLTAFAQAEDRLGADVKADLAAPQIPVPSLETNWQTALLDLQTAAADGSAGANAVDANLIDSGTAQLTAGKNQLAIVQAAINPKATVSSQAA